MTTEAIGVTVKMQEEPMEVFYILDNDHNPVREINPENWEQWYANSNRNIRRTILHPNIVILTTFSGCGNVDVEDQIPAMFETKIFGGILDGEEIFSSTNNQAHRDHDYLYHWCTISLMKYHSISDAQINSGSP